MQIVCVKENFVIEKQEISPAYLATYSGNIY